GFYSFVISPGSSTVMDVSAHIFARKELDHIGLGPLTSMFLFDETNRSRFDDFRPAVHDSDGLVVRNGAGETLWRALANPKDLQVSSFVDDGPKGFGLMQRPKNFSDFADLEAAYHKRPGLWVTPGENWGKGSVTLVEIPADREIYDNIVAYWRPRTPIPAGGEHQFTYRLNWGGEPAPVKPITRVINTRMGKRFAGGYIVTIDFADHAVIPQDLSMITRHISVNRGTVSGGILQKNPETGGARLAFTFDPKGARSVDMRAQLMMDGHSISEVWLYRWTE
ncbi:MAG: glucan biosynthesis protein, partial [Amylibacter sp.]